MVAIAVGRDPRNIFPADFKVPARRWLSSSPAIGAEQG